MNSAPSQNPLDMSSVPFEHGGTHLTFSFTWGVFETLQNEWGDEFQTRLSALFVKGDVTHLRLVASLASGQSFDLGTNLPVQKTINALYRAYELGWSGRDVGAGPEEVSEGTGKKPLRFARFSIATLMRGLLSGSRGASSSP